MKRALCILLIAIMITAMFSGCTKEPEPLRICIDAMIDTDYRLLAESNFEKVEDMMEIFLGRLEDAGGPTDILVEYIPMSGSERETMLDRLRVEIGSGDGPDIFIMTCDSKNSKGHKCETLFLMPEKAMNLGTFLSLDEYMEQHTQYAEWDQMNQVVLDAGKNKEGQQIVPLAYTFPLVTFRQWEASHTPDKSLTWNDMLTSDDINLRAAAVWTDNLSTDYEGCPFMNSRDGLPEYILGDIADFETEELLFTEDELRRCMEEIYDLGKRFTEGEFAGASAHYNEFVGINYNEDPGFIDYETGKKYKIHCGVAANTDATMIPLYSDDGGVTATITAYAAINRNTLRPKDAYEVIDFLLSTEIQRGGGIYQYFYADYTDDTQSVPMHNNLMNGPENSLYEWRPYAIYDMTDEANPLRPIEANPSRGGWYMKPVNFETYAAVRDQITRARFRSELDIQFDKLYWDYHRADLFDTGEQDEIVAKAYETMKRMMKE